MLLVSQKLKIKIKEICEVMNLAYSSYMRWNKRMSEGLPVIKKPGPKKVKMLDPEELLKELKKLKHKRKRSKGAFDIYEKYKEMISRRNFYEILKQARQDDLYIKMKGLKRISWFTPGLVWSMDVTELNNIEGKKVYLLTMRDMATGYKFAPLSGNIPCGEEVAGYLHSHFVKHGAPLFLKRDNGGNLNHSAVNEILNQFCVIPLNNPTYYPQYNGGIEHDQNEIKEALKNEIMYRPKSVLAHMGAYVKNVVNDLNHKFRRSKKGKNSCQLFFSKNESAKFKKRDRKNVENWLKYFCQRIIEKMKEKSDKNILTAWRISIETWLRLNKHISVSINGKVLPHFSSI